MRERFEYRLGLATRCDLKPGLAAEACEDVGRNLWDGPGRSDQGGACGDRLGAETLDLAARHSRDESQIVLLLENLVCGRLTPSPAPFECRVGLCCRIEGF